MVVAQLPEKTHWRHAWASPRAVRQPSIFSNPSNAATPCMATPHQTAATGSSTGAEGNSDGLADGRRSNYEPEKQERGVPFVTGGAFYRTESGPARDLSILAAAAHKATTGRLRVLDVMAGSGMRGARYVAQAGADVVWCNDLSKDPRLHNAIVHNVCSAACRQAPPAAYNSGSSRSQNNRSSSKSTTLGIPVAAKQQEEKQHQQWTLQPRVSGMIVATADASAGSASAGQQEATMAEGDGMVDVHVSAAHFMAQAQMLALLGRTGTAHDWHFSTNTCNGSGNNGISSNSGANLSSVPCPSVVTTSDWPLAAEASSYTSAGRVHAAGATANCSLHDPGAQSGPMPEQAGRPAASGIHVRVSHGEANRLMCGAYISDDFYDLVDVDSFGSDSMHLAAALDCVAFGGLLYLTCTDGFSASGKSPERALAAFGAYTRAVPWAPEQGLRMLIGAAVRTAATRGLALRPVFSLYSDHGPVYRTLLRVTRSAEWPAQHYGMVGHCFVHGEARALPWRSCGDASCRCGLAPPTSTPQAVIGPLWTGPLHDARELSAMVKTAAGKGWLTQQYADELQGKLSEALAVMGGMQHGARRNGTGTTVSTNFRSGNKSVVGSLGSRCEEAAASGKAAAAVPAIPRGRIEAAPPLNTATASHAGAHDAGTGLAPHAGTDAGSGVWPGLYESLQSLVEEAHPGLPPGYHLLDVMSKLHFRGGVPPRDKLIDALREEGHVTARVHMNAKAIRSSARLAQIVDVAVRHCGMTRRHA